MKKLLIVTLVAIFSTSLFAGVVMAEDWDSLGKSRSFYNPCHFGAQQSEFILGEHYNDNGETFKNYGQFLKEWKYDNVEKGSGWAK